MTQNISLNIPRLFVINEAKKQKKNVCMARRTLTSPHVRKQVSLGRWPLTPVVFETPYMASLRMRVEISGGDQRSGGREGWRRGGVM